MACTEKPVCPLCDEAVENAEYLFIESLDGIAVYTCEYCGKDFAIIKDAGIRYNTNPIQPSGG